MQKVQETLGTWQTHIALGDRKRVTTALHSRLTASKIENTKDAAFLSARLGLFSPTTAQVLLLL